MAKGQKNFGLGEALDPFERWCAENAYEERIVFLAGWMSLQGLTHDQRKRLFAQIGEWANRGYSMDASADSGGERQLVGEGVKGASGDGKKPVPADGAGKKRKSA